MTGPLTPRLSWPVDVLSGVRDQFARTNCAVVPGVLSSDLCLTVRQRLGQGTFVERDHEGLGTEQCLEADGTVSLLHFLANDPVVYAGVQDLTGCDAIGCFTGRVYRMLPGGAHHVSWHNDAVDHRLIGMSINLGSHPYEGGVFRLRDATSGAVLDEVANTGEGDALLFRIDERLEHQVTPIAGAVEKLAFVGWFRSTPDFLTILSQGL